jgi:hypothetical protein
LPDDVILGVHITGMRKFVITTFLAMVCGCRHCARTRARCGTRASDTCGAAQALTWVLAILYLEDITVTDIDDPEEDAKVEGSPEKAVAVPMPGALSEAGMCQLPAAKFMTLLPEWHRQSNAKYIWKPTLLSTAGAGAQVGRGGERDR